MSTTPILSEKHKETLLAFQETYDTETLITALLYKETAGCHCDKCYARYLRVMADRVDPCGAPRVIMTYDGMTQETGNIQEEVK